jgi:hypothetical protein
MLTTRRVALIGLLCAPASAEAGALVPRPDLVEPFTPDLQEQLFRRRMPFLATFQHGSMKLGFAAVMHATDENDPSFATIRGAFDRIRPQRVILEGFPAAWGDAPSRIVNLARNRMAPDADAYARSEAVYAAALALDRQIPFAGGEMPESELVDLLAAQGFARTDLFNVMLIKVLEQEMRGGAFVRPEGRAFEEALGRWTPMLAQTHGVEPTTQDAFGAWYLATFGTTLAGDDTWYERAWPVGNGIGGRIARAQSLARDRFLYGQIIAALNRSERVLVAYGGSHLAGIWRALVAALGEPELTDPPPA